MEELFKDNGVILTPKDNDTDILVVKFCGDMNDGDYLHKSYEIDLEDEYTQKYFKDLISGLRKVDSGHITASGELSGRDKGEFTEDESDIIDELCYLPQGEYGCHSIYIEELTYYDSNGVAFNIEL